MVFSGICCMRLARNSVVSKGFLIPEKVVNPKPLNPINPATPNLAGRGLKVWQLSWSVEPQPSSSKGPQPEATNKKQASKQASKQANEQASEQSSKRASKQASKQANKQAHTHTQRHTYTEPHTHKQQQQQLR